MIVVVAVFVVVILVVVVVFVAVMFVVAFMVVFMIVVVSGVNNIYLKYKSKIKIGSFNNNKVFLSVFIFMF